MKFIKVIFFVIALLLVIPTVYAGDAYVDNINVEAKINVDGSMDVVETIKWNIEGSLNGVYRDILITNSVNSLNGASKIVVNNVLVDGVSYNYSNTTLQNGTSGKYNVNSINGGKQIKIFTPSEDEYKTTTISYTLYDVVVEYNDIAELYWNFIGNGWEYGLNDVNINITLPGKSNILKIFAHGPLYGYSEITGENSVNLKVNNLRSGEAVDARLLFDNTLVSSNKVQNVNKLQSILAEEKELAEQANLKRQQAKRALYISIALIAFAILLPIVIYIKEYRKRTKPDFNGKYYRELPEDYGPAVMNIVLYPISGRMNINDMLATLLDLVRKKYIEIEPIIKSGKKKPTDYLLKLVKTDLEQLNESEKHFIQKLIFVDTNEIALKDLSKKNSKNSKAEQDAYSAYMDWYKIVKDVAKEKEVIKEDVKVTKNVIKCALSIVLAVIVATFGMLANFDDILGMGVITAVITIVETIVVWSKLQELQIRTKKGIEHNEMWKAFKKFLQDFSKLDERDYKSIAIWEHFLVYAAGLGIAKQVIKQLKIIYPTEFEEQSNLFNNYATIALLSDNNSFSSFTSSFTSATTTAFSTSSSANGSGGGFSGGGGFRRRRRRWRWLLAFARGNLQELEIL